MNRKQSVRRVVWLIGGRRKRRRQKGSFLPIAPILGSLAKPVLGTIVDPVIKKVFGGKRQRRRRRYAKRQNSIKTTCGTTTCDITKHNLLWLDMKG